MTNRMIVFGGIQDGCVGTVFTDVWVLTNANNTAATPEWVQLAPTGDVPTAGPANFFGVYDRAENRLIVFTLSFSPTAFDLVWVLENANGLGGAPVWTQLSPAGAPPSVGTGHMSIVYDAANNRAIVFGDTGDNGTWVLDNANGLGGTPAWRELAPGGTLPVARDFGDAVFAPDSGRMIIFGGRRASDVLINDAWVLVLRRKILVAPLSHDFGAIDAFTTQDAIVTISNTGGADLKVAGVAVTAGNAFFSITGSDPLDVLSVPFFLSPGDDVFVTVTFFPTSEGLHVGTLTVNSDDPDDSTINVSLVGNGLVGVVDSLGRLIDVVGCVFKIDRSLILHKRLEVDAIDILHYEVVNVLFVIDVVGQHDVGMVQQRGRFRLAVKSRQVRRIVDALLRQDFDGDQPLHLDVFCQIHAAHAAAAQVAQQFVLSKEETLVPSLEKLVALPVREEFGVDEPIDDGRRVRLVVSRFDLAGDACELVVVDQAAAPYQFEKFRNSWLGHTEPKFRRHYLIHVGLDNDPMRWKYRETR